MQALFNWLQRPYPFDRSWRAVLRVAIWSGFFVASFLFLFRPFGTQIGPGAMWAFLRICVAFGLVTFFTILIVNVLCRSLPHIFDEEKWRVWKEILFNIFFVGSIGCGNLVLAHFSWGLPLTWESFWDWQLVTFSVGIIPTLFGVFWAQLKWSRKYASEAAALHRPAIAASNAIPALPLALEGDNQNEVLRLQPDQIAYLAAADNYVQVFYFENGALKNRVLRATLRKMEDALAAANGQFFRCHRTFIVNLQKVEKISGNAQGYRLHLEGCEASLPVSRNFNEAIQARFSAA
jgi:hypothetical protein